MVIENVEIILLQIANELAMFIHGNKKHIHLVNSLLNRDDVRLVESMEGELTESPGAT